MVIEIIILTVFLLFFAFGFYIIYKQVALVKKGEFRNKDRFQCIFYGIIFSLSIMLVFAVAVIFTVRSPEFWDPATTPPEVPPLTLLIPFLFCLLYVSLYPLIDFLFIAVSGESDEGLTAFHKFINNKVIKLSRNKLVRVLIAVIFYLLVFILPPILLSLLNLPFIMIWITWMLFYPLMILTFYGSKGYIAGISDAYYHIPNIKRSIFLNFENSKRGMKQFTSQPGPYIILGLMLFVFVWAWISFFQTIMFFFTGKFAISTMSSVFVFVTLFFGILGYFTRFWGRKIKYRGIDIYFAAYLMASIGINVLVNFLIVNPDKLLYTFNLWAFTDQIVPNFLMFAWAAVIEEIVLIFFTSYFFLARKNEFVTNIKISKITKSGQTFDPIPLFNLIKHKNPKIRKLAEETLVMMFERIPLKNNTILNEWKFKNSLLDGICDYNRYSRNLCNQILIQLEKDVPEIALPWIIEALKAPNYDKCIPIARTLLKANIEFVEKIPESLFLNLIEDPEWRLRYLGLMVLSRLISKKKDLIHSLNIKKLILDPNYRIVVKIFNLLADSSYELPIDIIIGNIFHVNDKISAAAIKNIKNLNVNKINRKIVSKLIPLIKNPSSSVRASIFNVFAKIGHFKKNDIPLLPFLDGLVDSNEKARQAAVVALKRYFEEEPELFDIDAIVDKIDPNNFEILNSVVTLLGELWKFNPEKIITTLLVFIKFENDELRENISEILTVNYSKSPDLVIQNLVKIPDLTTYITKGIITKTLIKIGKSNPKKIIPLLLNYSTAENDDIRLNALDSIDGLIDEFIEYVDVRPIILIVQKDRNNQVVKKASSIISNIAKKKPTLIKPYISEFFTALTEQSTKVKIVLTKSLLEIAKIASDIIPINSIMNLIDDKDSFIRETSAKILGLIGNKRPLPVVDSLINIALHDEEWIVREAAVSSLGKILDLVEEKEEIIEKLISLLNDEQNWVRLAVLNILSDLREVNNSHLPFNKLQENLNSTDPRIRQASANLIKIYSKEIESVIDKLMIPLGDESKEVRNSMINNFVELIQEIGLERILTKLLQNLSDEGSLETQRSIALILGRTAKYENEKIKKRVISLLKIRCEMSQDPIICEILHQLKES